MSRLPEASPLPTSVPVHDVDAWPTPGRSALAVLAILALWLLGGLVSSAYAGNISWSIGVNVPIHGYGHGHGVVHHRPGAVYTTPGYPVVAYPPPAYRPPVQPVVIHGSPVYVYPAPHVAPPVAYVPAPVPHYRPGRPHRPHWPHHGHHGHRGEERWHDGGRWERY